LQTGGSKELGETTMDTSKLVLPGSILLSCIILGSLIYASQVNKQRSIEKQQQIELKAKTEKEMYSIAKNRAEKHALNALALLKGKTELTRCAGMGRRQGKDDDGPIKIKWQKS